MKRKLLAILTSIVLLCAMLPLGAVSVNAATTGTYGGMNYKIANGEVTITGYTSDLPEHVTIPATIEGCPVTVIGDDAFYGCRLLTLVMADTITEIGKSAFSGCFDLGYVDMSDAVVEIKDSAFCACNLFSIDLPNGVTTIGKYAFQACGLSSVTIPDSVTYIGDCAFKDCSSLTSIEVGSKNT